MNGACIIPLERVLGPQTELIKSHIISFWRRRRKRRRRRWKGESSARGAEVNRRGGEIIDIDVKQSARVGNPLLKNKS